MGDRYCLVKDDTPPSRHRRMSHSNPAIATLPRKDDMLFGELSRERRSSTVSTASTLTTDSANGEGSTATAGPAVEEDGDQMGRMWSKKAAADKKRKRSSVCQTEAVWLRLLREMSKRRTAMRKHSIRHLTHLPMAIISGAARRASAMLCDGELPGAEMLAGVEALRIELDRYDTVQKAVQRFSLRNRCDFDPVPFSVRSLEPTASTLYKAEVRSEKKGFLLRGIEAGGAQICAVSMGGESTVSEAEVAGKVKHHNGTTLYEFHRSLAGGGRAEFTVLDVHNAPASKDPVMLIEEVHRWSLLCAKCLGLSFHTVEYVVSADGKEVARVRPTKVSRGKAYAVRFARDCGLSAHLRCVVVAWALLASLDHAYPQLKHILEEQAARKLNEG